MDDDYPQRPGVSTANRLTSFSEAWNWSFAYLTFKRLFLLSNCWDTSGSLRKYRTLQLKHSTWYITSVCEQSPVYPCAQTNTIIGHVIVCLKVYFAATVPCCYHQGYLLRKHHSAVVILCDTVVVHSWPYQNRLEDKVGVCSLGGCLNGSADRSVEWWCFAPVSFTCCDAWC